MRSPAPRGVEAEAELLRAVEARSKPRAAKFLSERVNESTPKPRPCVCVGVYIQIYLFELGSAYFDMQKLSCSWKLGKGSTPKCALGCFGLVKHNQAKGDPSFGSPQARRNTVK